MPFTVVANTLSALTPQDSRELISEFMAIRRELDDVRSALAATRALLVAGTAIGAGYNTTATNIGPAITATPQQTPRFTSI